MKVDVQRNAGGNSKVAACIGIGCESIGSGEQARRVHELHLPHFKSHVFFQRDAG
jgi:hypothetical protein